MSADEDYTEEERAAVDALMSRLDEYSTRLTRQSWRRRLFRRWDRFLFERRLRRVWGDAFDLFDFAVELSTNAGDRFVVPSRQEADAPPISRLGALRRLHARSCSVAQEVGALMRAGHASGAYSRWRTLHENAVVALLLREGDGDGDLSERYLLHHYCNSLRTARLQREHGEAIGLGPFTEEDERNLKLLERIVADLVERYGADYRRPYYGWAAEYLGKKSPAFTDLEEAVDLNHWRPYYHLASLGVHPMAKSLHWNLGIGDFNEFLLAGPTNTGFTDPAHQSILTLNSITFALLVHAPEDFMAVAEMKALTKLADGIGETFSRAQGGPS